MRRDQRPAEREGGDWIAQALERHERPLTLYTSRLLAGDQHRARDLVQEAFLRLCEQTPEEVEGRVAEWLFRVCRNLALDHRRKEDRMSTLSDEEARRSKAAGPAPFEGIERRDTLAHVLELMQGLRG
jgi:DNA-directed RNA polymerase specialized sigma24 family protein